jgi:hypothetical protein
MIGIGAPGQRLVAEPMSRGGQAARQGRQHGVAWRARSNDLPKRFHTCCPQNVRLRDTSTNRALFSGEPTLCPHLASTSLANVAACPGRKDRRRQGGKGRERPLGREIGYAYLWVRSPMRFRSRPIIGHSATTPTLPLSYEFVIARCTTRIRGLRLAAKDRIAGLTSLVHAHRQCGR